MLPWQLGSACHVSLTRVRLCFLIGSACQVSQIKRSTHDNSKLIHQVYWRVNIGGSTICSKSFKFIVASTSIADFQLIVNLFLNPYRKGVEYVQKISSNKIQRLIVEHIFSTNKSDISAFQVIVEFNQQHQSTLQQDLANAWSFIATILIANHETSNNFQQRVMPSHINQLIVKLTPNTDSEGVLAQENILNATGAILTSEGARVPSSKLIVGTIAEYFVREYRVMATASSIIRQERSHWHLPCWHRSTSASLAALTLLASLASVILITLSTTMASASSV